MYKNLKLTVLDLQELSAADNHINLKEPWASDENPDLVHTLIAALWDSNQSYPVKPHLDFWSTETRG